MEWCVVLYADRRMAKCIYRVISTLFVLLITSTAAVWVMSEQSVPWSSQDAGLMEAESSADPETTWNEASFGFSDSLTEIPLSAALLAGADPDFMKERFVPAATESADETVEIPPLSLDVLKEPPGQIQTAGMLKEKIAERVEKEHTAKMMPDAGTNGTEGKGEGITSGIISDIIQDNPADTIQETPERDEEPTVPSEPLQPENGGEPGVSNGFLINESGIICGIDDPSAVVTNGFITLPAEGCTGIAEGAFAQPLPGVREIYIPGNITTIGEGAFTGLTDMEWFEAGSSGSFYTEEGILFSENGTCILAFPLGRTGVYKVPSHVERLAAGSFTGSKLTGLDISACTLTDIGDLPAEIELVNRR